MTDLNPPDLQIVPLGSSPGGSTDRPSLLDMIRSDIQNSSFGMADDLVLHQGKVDLRTKTVLWTWSNTENDNYKILTQYSNLGKGKC